MYDDRPGSTTEYFRGWVGQGEENALISLLFREGLDEDEPPVDEWTSGVVVQP